MKTHCSMLALVTSFVVCGAACSSDDSSSPAAGGGNSDAASASAGDAATGNNHAVDAGNNYVASDSGHPVESDDAGPTAIEDASVDGDASVVSDAGHAGDGGTPDECSGIKYCDDFESYDGNVADKAKLGPWTASVGGTGVMMRVDTKKAHHGTKSLHITVPAGDAAHATLHQAAAMGLVTGNDLFGRAMVFYSNADTNGLPLGVHSWLFQSTGNSTTPAGAVSMNVGGNGAAAKPQLNYHPPAPRTEDSAQGGAMTAGVWHCVQWQYDGAGAMPSDTAKVWLDGAVVIDVAKTKGWDFATPWLAFDFGFNHYQTTTNAVDVYLDQFALDGAMIDCPT